MLKKVVPAVLLTVALGANAHLCDDVFRQARDNLAVKVDVRDGQLRIGREASFRVFVLNTMDRDIFEIRLRVDSEQFTARVQPSPQWRDFPRLHTSARGGPGQERPVVGRGGGQREFFTVNLTRKPGVPDGVYRIGLDLFSDQKQKSFVTLQMAEAADITELAEAGRIVIDGTATREEWGTAQVCSGFTAYRREGRYDVNVPARWQTRVRVLHDKSNIYAYFSVDAVPGARQDVLSVYAAATPESEVRRIDLDLVRGPSGGEVKWALNAARSEVEAKIPKRLLGLSDGMNSFYMNFTRRAEVDGQQETSYWRGNNFSYMDGTTYSHFVAKN